VLLDGIVMGTESGPVSKLVTGFEGADEELDVEKRSSATQNSRKDAIIPYRMVVDLLECEWVE
jgi:hypothetical protein